MARGNPLFTAVLTGGNLTLPQSQVAAAGIGPGAAIPINHAGSSQVTIIWSAGCTGGQVDVEISDMPNEPASWWPFQSATLPASPLPAASVVQIPFPTQAIRTNIKQAIAGGTITSNVQAWN